MMSASVRLKPLACASSQRAVSGSAAFRGRQNRLPECGIRSARARAWRAEYRSCFNPPGAACRLRQSAFRLRRTQFGRRRRYPARASVSSKRIVAADFLLIPGHEVADVRAVAARQSPSASQSHAMYLVLLTWPFTSKSEYMRRAIEDAAAFRS